MLAMLVLLGSGLVSASDEAEITPELRAAVEQLVEITYASLDEEQLFGQIAEIAAGEVLKSVNNMTPEQVERINKTTHEYMLEMAGDLDDLIDEMIPIYAKFFTHDEILQMVAFYETPLGKKTIEVMPELAVEMAGVSMRWSMSKLPEVTEKMKAQLES